MRKLNAPWLNQPEIKTLLAAFNSASQELRFVGGCVRDTIRGKQISDIDAATPAKPEQVIELLEKANIRALPTGLLHGTITALVNDKPFQITTLRKDIKTDGRHAEIAFTDDWLEDARRRDFTMNALYLSADETLTDYWSGEEDARAGRVIFIGKAEERIAEDYLRILRFFRFCATTGNGQYDAASLAACAALREGVKQLSGERIQQEMLKLLASNNSAPALAEMEMAGVLSQVIPAAFLRRVASVNSSTDESLVLFDVKTIQKLDKRSAPSLIKLAALIGDIKNLAALAARWKLSQKQQKHLSQLLVVSAEISPSMSELAQKKLIRKHGKENYAECVLFAWARANTPWESHQALLKHVGWVAPEFPVKPADLMALGMEEGKAMGDTLRKLEALWEEAGYVSSKEDLLKQV